MKKSTLTRVIWAIALLGVMVASFGAVVPAFAQDGTPVVPATPVPGGVTTAVVPNTGGNNSGFFLSGWTLLIILGVVVVILLIALLARGNNTNIVD